MLNNGRDRFEEPSREHRYFLFVLCPQKLATAGALLEGICVKDYKGHFTVHGRVGI